METILNSCVFLTKLLKLTLIFLSLIRIENLGKKNNNWNEKIV
jgi:hypothetical protein